MDSSKIYILDTSVLLHDPSSIFKFEDNIVIIPGTVISELDKKKTETSYAGQNAREVVRILEKLALKNEGNIITINDNGKLIIDTNFEKNIKPLSWLNEDDKPEIIEAPKLTNDEEILLFTKKQEGILVTKDKILRIIAIVNNIKAEDYKNDQIEKNINDGYKNIKCNKKIIDKIYTNKEIDAPKSFDNNFYYILNSYQKNSALAKCKNSKLTQVFKLNVHGITPKNVEQTFALDALMDKNNHLVTLTGQAGTGKTLLTLAAGLQQVVEIKNYKRVLVARPTVGIEDIGYLPGNIEEKLNPWMQPIMDNLDFLYQDLDPKEVIEEYKDRQKLKIEPLAYIRGRSIPKQFFIVDEAQNLSPKQIKTILTRAGKGTKIILTGDISQIDCPYLDKRSNGLSYVINKFEGQDNYAHINLTKSERSELASKSAKLL